MKTERISIFNYEAFYLDHLEGTLGDEDTALLLAFLDKNPQLQLEEDSLPSLFAEDITLSQRDKNALKQTDDDELIAFANVEYFMIANAEGILTADKQHELTLFIETHPQLEKDNVYFNSLTLSPNLNEVYSDKQGLKKKTIVLWPYISIAAAAASVIIAFFMLTNSGADNPPTFAKDERVNKGEQKDAKQLDPIDEVPQMALQVKDKLENQNSTKKDQRNRPAVSNKVLPDQLANTDDKKVSPLNRRPVRNIIPSIENYDIQPITIAVASGQQQTDRDVDVAYTGFEHMKDPIQGVTSRINKRLKADVDFRTAKSTKEQSGGFYIKIGKFEMLRKKHRD
jgi:hypothetical protein